MGYRSDWQLVVAGKPLALHKFLEWIKKESAARSEQSGYNAFTEIVENADYFDEMIDWGYLRWYGSGWKCYSPFESEIQDIRQCAVDKFGLESSYVRIGEEYNDIEVENDGEMWVGVSRTIDEPENIERPSEEDKQELKEFLEAKEGKVPPDSNRWEEIVNE